eukprot:sb/3474841/
MDELEAKSTPCYSQVNSWAWIYIEDGDSWDNGCEVCRCKDGSVECARHTDCVMFAESEVACREFVGQRYYNGCKGAGAAGVVSRGVHGPVMELRSLCMMTDMGVRKCVNVMTVRWSAVVEIIVFMISDKVAQP